MEQEIYFKVCKDNNFMPPLDSDRGTVVSPRLKSLSFVLFFVFFCFSHLKLVKRLKRLILVRQLLLGALEQFHSVSFLFDPGQ